MLFQATIDIPKNTSSTSPVVQTMATAKGIITKFMVRPHAGHAGLAHLAILYHEHRIAPSNEDMDLHGDEFPLDWEDYYECYERPFELKLVGWNEDDTYQHSFDVYIAILPRKAILTARLIDALNEFFQKILGVFGIFTPSLVDIEEQESE